MNSLTSKFNKRAYIFPVILIVTLSIGAFFVVVTQMQMSNKSRFVHLNDYQRAFNIAYSSMVTALADLMKVQWSNRSFALAPAVTNASLYGGKYNLLIEDQDTDEKTFNVKIRVDYNEKIYLYYWRLRYVPDLLDFTSFTIPQYFAQLDGTTLDDLNAADLIIENDLKKRDENQDKAFELAKRIDSAQDTKSILDLFGIPSEETLDADQTRPPDVPLEVETDDLPAEDLVEIVETTEGAVTHEIENLVENFPLTDIYPPELVPDIRVIYSVPLTRNEIAVYIVRLLEIPETDDSDAIEAFSDVTSVDPSEEPVKYAFNKSVSAAHASGLVVGWNGRFWGENIIVRRDLAQLLRNVVDYIDEFYHLLDNRLSTKYSKIKNWALDNVSTFDNVNRESGISVGDGIEMLKALN